MRGPSKIVHFLLTEKGSKKCPNRLPKGVKMEAKNHPKKWSGKCLIFGSILEAKMLQNGPQDRAKMGAWSHLGPILAHLGQAVGQSCFDVAPS